ncbi:MAG TPA: C-type lectin domain-containing protein, partial [Kofleriaceae bacterium]|nr:C-type lectin domain-containing protein [Kofleriaceae bacterium]
DAGWSAGCFAHAPMPARHFTSGVLTLASCLSAACQHDPEPVPPPPVPAQAQCPEGFGPLGGGVEDGCYSVRQLPADWMAGEDACEEFLSDDTRAHLVVVDRAIEHDVLSEMSAGGTGIWIGRFQRDPDDDFRNVNYVDWQTEYFTAGEPNDYAEDCDALGSCRPAPGTGDERCIEYSHETLMWNDEVCFDRQTVVCEWDGVPPLAWRPYRD